MDSAWDGYINLNGVQFVSRGCVEHLPARYYYSLIELVVQSFSAVSVSYSSNGVYYSLSTEYCRKKVSRGIEKQRTVAVGVQPTVVAGRCSSRVPLVRNCNCNMIVLSMV